MIIAADENIPYVQQAFGPHGEVRAMAGREISAETIVNADALLVRSVMPVNASLLSQSAVRFVASATAGVDHVDTQWLESRGIEFASAPGSNAESVAQYIAAALFFISDKLGMTLRGKTIGIVGVGQCGSRVERIARAIGLEPVLCDPPLERKTASTRFRPLSELTDCDFLTLHVPLTRHGEDSTINLIGCEFFEAIKPSAVVINAARGGVLDERALLSALTEGRLAGAALDTWEDEPRIGTDLMKQTLLATPHIAGYSLDGKLRGTEMILSAFCRYFNFQPRWSAGADLPPGAGPVTIEANDDRDESVLGRIVRESYSVRRDDKGLRAIEGMNPQEAAAHFDRLRKEYGPRREFSATRVIAPPGRDSLRESLRGLGFDLRDGPDGPDS